MKKRVLKEKVILLPIALILILILSVIFFRSSINREVVSKERNIENEGKSSEMLKNIIILLKNLFRSEDKQYSVLSSPSTTEFYGMSIESVAGDSNQIIINTTGAMYILNRNGMEMWRRIDPEINDYNQRLVARLDFDNDIGPLNIMTNISTNKNYSIVNGTKANFTFNSDSFFIVTAKQQIYINYTNLIINAPWNKGSGTDRVWTDGFGGSLHAKTIGYPTTLISGTDFTRFS